MSFFTVAHGPLASIRSSVGSCSILRALLARRRFSARLTGPRQRNAAPVVSALQTRTYAEAKASPTEVSSILEQRIRGVQEESGLAETGRVLSVGYVFQHNNKGGLAADERCIRRHGCQCHGGMPAGCRWNFVMEFGWKRGTAMLTGRR